MNFTRRLTMTFDEVSVYPIPATLYLVKNLLQVGSLVHLLIGSRYAVQRSGNVLMAFNNKEASSAIPLFSPILVPMAQSFGPLRLDIFSSPTLRAGVSIST
ncbi:uncharacterized protein LOC131607402 [Vicia villosa]|uniref:uncharacterized protein LOC131607402 n=1 Tax=Vicia villosa TaxID=3911 RepID=UPI00273CD18A|nr:uncharacterized protein LOC131607402 [Vicia villosa]XP_058735394.1 uncharacterized protein LOC131607402 [Vicia villosa]XP_058735395.1 uncharacterized protein LOC131607402 [Vicia villosa]